MVNSDYGKWTGTVTATNEKMIFIRMFKRCVQTLIVAVIVTYFIIFLYQITHRSSSTSSSTLNILDWEEKSANVIPRDYDEVFTQSRLKIVGLQTDNAIVKVKPTSEEILPMLVTATMKPPTISLEDVFISVKTTKSYHSLRLPIIVKTWFQLAKEHTWFFTDSDDPFYQTKTNGHMINTNCSSSHNRKALCCKMSVEFDVFLESNKKWFCHFDDDNYVNVPRLVRLLDDYNPQEDWYLGKPSIRAPLEITSRDNTGQKISFWFATGGAGFCLSRALALKMMPVASNGKFISIGEKIRLPDDVTMGYIIEHLLKKSLTVVDQFHSHLEPMKFLRRDTLHDQISFSYSRNKEEWNVLNIDGFDIKYDPKRFLSLHCYLFPYFSFCPR